MGEGRARVRVRLASPFATQLLHIPPPNKQSSREQIIHSAPEDHVALSYSVPGMRFFHTQHAFTPSHQNPALFVTKQQQNSVSPCEFNIRASDNRRFDTLCHRPGLESSTPRRPARPNQHTTHTTSWRAGGGKNKQENGAGRGGSRGETWVGLLRFLFFGWVRR